MAANPAVPVPLLSLEIQKTPTENFIHCSGRITADTNEQLQSTVREMVPEKKADRSRPDQHELH